MWNKTTYPFLVQALCIIPLKSIRMWASFVIFENISEKGWYFLELLRLTCETTLIGFGQ